MALTIHIGGGEIPDTDPIASFIRQRNLCDGDRTYLLQLAKEIKNFRAYSRKKFILTDDLKKKIKHVHTISFRALNVAIFTYLLLIILVGTLMSIDDDNCGMNYGAGVILMLTFSILANILGYPLWGYVERAFKESFPEYCKNPDC
jgi:hypothetical protein